MNGSGSGVRATVVGTLPASVESAAGELGEDTSTGARGRLEGLESGRGRLIVDDGKVHDVLITAIPSAARRSLGIDRLEVVVDGWRFEVDVEDDARARLRERATSERAAGTSGGPLELRAIIPGRVVSVDVAIGDAVESGERLLVVEAMKMQNELRATRGGTVARIAVVPGQTVERGDLLLVVE
ncbi:MAG TPA: biotin/lipoyl-containing protein [Candidatus Limnocylindria bacterium]|nr:biotin/lipoyl-containing protein [Candidatus Limnocylindria bacterium]